MKTKQRLFISIILATVVTATVSGLLVRSRSENLDGIRLLAVYGRSPRETKALVDFYGPDSERAKKFGAYSKVGPDDRTVALSLLSHGCYKNEFSDRMKVHYGVSQIMIDVTPHRRIPFLRACTLASQSVVRILAELTQPVAGRPIRVDVRDA